jgi:hypothetical protein
MVGTGDDQYGKLLVGDTAALDGTLQVDLAGGFAPGAGDEFQIISASAGFGQTAFDDALLPALSGNLFWNLIYDEDSLVLRVLSPSQFGDYNDDGVIDAADYTVWRDMLTATVAPYSGADGDGDGLVGSSDYHIWRTHFGQFLQGAAAAPAAVPEPASGALGFFGTAVAATSGLNRRRRRLPQWTRSPRPSNRSTNVLTLLAAS